MNIMKARLEKKLTQAQLAQQINELPKVVQDYEAGKAIPNQAVRTAVCGMCSAASLLTVPRRCCRSSPRWSASWVCRSVRRRNKQRRRRAVLCPGIAAGPRWRDG